MAYKSLKLWFDEDLAAMLADKILDGQAGFPKSEFIEYVSQRIPELELKDRVEIIADGLFHFLNKEYQQALPDLLEILGPENEEETGMFTNYYWVMPIAKFVEKYGLDYPELSYRALEEITKRNTSEYAIRPFIVKHQTQTMQQMNLWAQSENFHVRRLASEGGRPRLPWASKLDIFIDDPTPLLPILRSLKTDPSKYVQKSVANCLNDILKDNKAIAQQELESWRPVEKDSTKWIIKHALRNELKREDLWAMSMLNQVYIK
ncbi:MAG: DNA alkylation repair protein [Balneolaceae bacterium]|nr:DNA alkylation repair protein [Balneolaceae bacterium]